MNLLLRFITSAILVMILSITFSQDNGPFQKKQELLRLYSEADRVYHEAETIARKENADESLQDALNQKALGKFKNILPVVTGVNDSLAFLCYFKTGVLEHYFENYGQANIDYNHAINLKKNIPSLQDSLLFKPYLYSGIIYYMQNKFDSALMRYKQAEVITDAFKVKLDESERLFNNLGALYYEAGNYRQAQNYFEKAISILSPGHPYYKGLLVNYKINLGQVLTKLEEFDEAKKVYQEMLHYDIDKDEIYHNIGTINLSQGAAKQSLEYFYKVNYSNSRNIRLYNDIAYAYYDLKQLDSASYYLGKADEENSKWNKERKNIAHGTTCKYKGDLLSEQGKDGEALKEYQQAIIQFDADFTDTNINADPSSFSGIFSYINLFNTLTAKAETFEKLYRFDKNRENLFNALQSYQSAFNLVGYVEKSYESDEARLFLNRIKYTVHARPISLSLQLYELTEESKYLEEAYRFDQLNKASVLSLGLRENSMQQQAGIPQELIDQVAAVKSAITRLSLKADRISDSSQLQNINNDIRDQEILLSKLQEKINSNAKYSQLQLADRIPSTSFLKKSLDNETCLLSYHLSQDELLILSISNHGFNEVRQAINPAFFSKVDSFIKALHNVNSNVHFHSEELSKELYGILINPVLLKLAGIKRLIIIPDDELSYLPFEALQDQDNNYLVQKFSVQYQYSTALLEINQGKEKYNKGIIAFAPFSETTPVDSFPVLSYSKSEVANIKGKVLTGREATKENFIKSANRYGIIHLATHASANDRSPLQSYIAFYPSKKDSAESYKLFAREIYDLKLNSTQLVILSACETGAGQLVKGEGLMSLSRAFAYAGCPNIVTSLWKAEDKTTAFITERFYHYKENGLPNDIALQKAKIDLLTSDQIQPQLKTPNYWSHLLFIGSYEPQNSSLRWSWIGLVIIIVATIFSFRKIKKLRRENGARVSHRNNKSTDAG